MASIRPEDLSPFGRLALKLDREFSELTRLGGQMEKVDLESDAGLDQALKILNLVAQYGQSVAGSMQEFAQALQEARDQSEAATKIVVERAQLVKQRRERQDELEQRLSKVKDEVKAAGEGLAAFSKPTKGEPSAEDKARIAQELERLQAPMAGFIAAAQAIKAEAAAGKFRRLERQTDSFIDTLQASRRKIERAVAPK